MSSLHLDWCSHEAAEYACKTWHYSQKMPAGKSVKVGVWENEKFIGCVIFSRGANNNIGNVFGLSQTGACELTRVALTNHKATASRIVSVAIRLLKKQSPGVRAIVSYADPAQGHHGGIYQAMGWLYAGRSRPQRELLVAGDSMHKRSASAKWGTASPEKIRAMTGKLVEYGPIEWKHTYYLPLDDAMRGQIAPLAKPYPKKQTPEQEIREHATRGDSFPKEDGGAKPTCSLHLDNHG